MRAWIDEGPEREAIYAKLLPGIRD